MKKKVTIIGAGNIGGATAKGLCGAADITVTARTQETLDKFKGLPISVSLDNNQAAQGADIVIFACAGKTMTVKEKMLMAGTSLASCGIAYALRYIHASAQGGVELGFFADEAVEVVAQTVKGAAAILEAHGSHPEAEIDKVTTPGGLTIKGLNAMEDAGFTPAVVKGLKANK